MQAFIKPLSFLRGKRRFSDQKNSTWRWLQKTGKEMENGNRVHSGYQYTGTAQPALAYGFYGPSANAGLCSSAYRHMQYHRPLWQPAGGESITCVRHGVERIAWGFTAFFLALFCSPLVAAHPKLAAAKGEQDGNDEPSPICLFILGSCTWYSIYLKKRKT